MFFVVLRLCLVFLVLNLFVFVSFKSGALVPWKWCKEPMNMESLHHFAGFFITA